MYLVQCLDNGVIISFFSSPFSTNGLIYTMDEYYSYDDDDDDDDDNVCITILHGCTNNWSMTL